MQLIPRAVDANYVPLMNVKTKQIPEKYNLKTKLKSRVEKIIDFI